MLSRRNFFRSIVGAGLLLPLTRCFSATRKNKIKVTFKPSPAQRGHELWKHTTSFKAGRPEEKNVVIIGAGISGLSAAYHLKKQGVQNIALLELDDKPGGNSVSGANAHSEYPYGAHYLTLPNPENKALISFLHEKGIISGFDASGRAIYNETDLCFDPEERLFIRGTFQEGLVPAFGLSDSDRQETDRFFKLIESYRSRKGKDGNYFFNIPHSLCSADNSLDHLDEISFSEFLDQENFKSGYLRWYLNYCCRDDFGGDAQRVSAWAGINYFAAHRPEPSNTDSARVLTWPEGNGRLVKLLQNDCGEMLRTACLVKGVKLEDNKVKLQCLDFKSNSTFELSCNYCIMAIPPFVASRIIDKQLPYAFDKVLALAHAPWLVAAVTLSHIPEGRGTGLCWDNVPYKSGSLGYIYNQHQELDRIQNKQVISLYMPLDQLDPKTSRKELEKRSADDWEKIVVSELEHMHQGIAENIEAIEICLWGHGMILPSKGLSRGTLSTELSAPISNRIFFAHSDLAAYSTFEEAFDQGHRAASLIKSQLT